MIDCVEKEVQSNKIKRTINNWSECKENDYERGAIRKNQLTEFWCSYNEKNLSFLGPIRERTSLPNFGAHIM